MRLTKYDKVLQKLLSYFWLLILEAEDLTRFSTSQFASPRRGTGTFYHARCVLIPSCTNQTLNLYKSDNNDAICFRFQRQSRPRVLAKVGRAGLLAAQVDIFKCNKIQIGLFPYIFTFVNKAENAPFFLKSFLSLCCIKDSSTDDPAPRSYGFGYHKQNVAACFEVLICVFCRLLFSYQDRM